MGVFTWAVSRSGYNWEPARDGAGISTEQLVTYDTGAGVWRYEPMRDTPDLFIEFAQLKGEEEEILRFAARYGALTTDVVVVDRAELEASETYQTYAAEAVRYDHPVQPKWDRSRTLQDHLCYPNGVPEYTFYATTLDHPHEPEDLALWVTHLAQMRQSLHSWRGCKPRSPPPAKVLRTIEAVLSGRANFTFDPDTGMPSLVPTDLRSALWLMFAYAVGGGREYRSCAQCGNLFPLSVAPPGADRRIRSDKKYCGPECQQATAYDLKKRKRAAEARGRGKGGGGRRET